MAKRPSTRKSKTAASKDLSEWMSTFVVSLAAA